MVTVDKRPDEAFDTEIVLKFWGWDEETQVWALNTVVDAPHKDLITCVAVAPIISGEKVQVVTTSLDCTFKVWDSVTVDGATTFTCTSSNTFKKTAATHAAFSEDGTILAVSYGSTYCLYDSHSLTLAKTLTSLHNRDVVRSIAFSGHLMVTITSRIEVWNLLTCAIEWSVKMNTTKFAIDAVTRRFAVFRNDHKAKKGCVHVFDASSAVPQWTGAVSTPKIVGLAFTSGLTGRDLVIVDGEFKVTRWSNDNKMVGETTTTPIKKLATRVVVDTITPVPVDAGDEIKADWFSSAMDSWASHAIPPVSRLVTRFFGVLKREVVDLASVDIEMEVVIPAVEEVEPECDVTSLIKSLTAIFEKEEMHVTPAPIANGTKVVNGKSDNMKAGSSPAPSKINGPGKDKDKSAKSKKEKNRAKRTSRSVTDAIEG
jgi:hypothetical protein